MPPTPSCGDRLVIRPVEELGKMLVPCSLASKTFFATLLRLSPEIYR